LSADGIDPVAILNAGVRFERLVRLAASDGARLPSQKQAVAIALSKAGKSYRRRNKSE